MEKYLLCGSQKFVSILVIAFEICNRFLIAKEFRGSI